jgi:hypothetical protein
LSLGWAGKQTFHSSDIFKFFIIRKHVPENTIVRATSSLLVNSMITMTFGLEDWCRLSSLHQQQEWHLEWHLEGPKQKTNAWFMLRTERKQLIFGDEIGRLETIGADEYVKPVR